MQKRLPVLFVLRGLYGNGPVRVALTLLRHLDRRRFDPGLFLMSEYPAMRADVPPDVRVHVGWRGQAGDSSLSWRIGAGLRLARTAMSYSVLVAAVEGQPTRAVDAAGRLLRKPVVGWVHAQLDHFVRDPQNRAAVARRYARMAQVVCCSEPTEAALRRLSPGAPTSVIPNPQDLARIADAALGPVPSWAEAAWRRPVIIAIGRLSNEKGHAALIQAHALAVRRRPHHLVILGQGSKQAALEKLVQQLGVNDSVFLPGFVENPFPLLARARALVLSSSSEGLPTVVLEAQALGVPVLTTDCGAVRELVARDAGLLVPVGDVAALSDNILNLLANDELHARLAANARARVEAYSVAAIVPRWEAALETARETYMAQKRRV